MENTFYPDERAVRAALGRVVARWRLTQAEIGDLLGRGQARGAAVLPGELDVEACRRAILVVEVDRGLAELFANLDAAVAWLRSPARPFGGRTPLEVMGDPEALAAIARVAGPWRTTGVAGGGAR